MKIYFILVCVLVSLSIISCSSPTGNHSSKIVAQPVITPQEGTFDTAKIVTIECSTSNAVIHYTTDGSSPTDSSEIYTTPLIILVTTTLKAIAFKEGLIPSSIVTANYIINPTQQVETPTFNIQEGTYAIPQTISIICSTSGAQIHYTIDGSEPTTVASLYTDALNISTTTTLKAKAFKSGLLPSLTAIRTYVISHPPLKPIIIPHLGDVGDYPDSVYFNGAYVHLTDDNNGIDAVPDVDGIKISWNHLTDIDLDFIKIWRSNIYYLPSLVEVATISPSQSSYIDNHYVNMNINDRYSYFIEVFDRAGNSTKSDTVTYKLIPKQLPNSPSDGTTLTTMSGLNFVFNCSGNVARFRVLLFDDLHNLVWYSNVEESGQTTYSIPYNGHLFTNKTLIWRVDGFEWNNILNMYIGSESHEFGFTVQ